MFQLSNKTKSIISRQIGLSEDEISALDMDDIEKKIEIKLGKKLEYMGHTDDRLLGRGNVYMYLSRLIGMSEIDKKISKI